MVPQRMCRVVPYSQISVPSKTFSPTLHRCIYLPNVIKIARHKHRVSLASSLLSRNWSCGVCHQKIDENYGAYSCMKNDCNYVAHSSCATRQDIWDGKDLEGEPEEVNESIEPPVEEISDGTILHFSHLEHPMRLVEDVNKWYDEKEICQACILPPYDGKVYTCMRMECGYVLHEECAYFPRVKQHPLHAHSLTLEPYGTQMIRKCHCCNTYSLGFKYVCHNTDGDDEGFSLDVRCALISEPYDYHSHMHPLFLTDSVIVCFICHLGHLRGALKCDECNFSLCFSCATLPYKVRYKNDEHLLTFLYGKAANGVYWCDLCERTINPVTTKITGFRGFYRCNECEVTLHTTCLLGVDMYMNHGSKVTVNKEEFSIVRNTTLTRPICKKCRRRCKYRVIIHIEVNLSRPLKGTIQVNEERYFVSYEGLTNICSGYGVYGHLVHVCPRRVLAEVVVSFLQTGISKAYPLSFLVRFCHGFISRDWMVRVVHMHRKANRLADGLVNYAFSLPLSFHLFQSSPESVAAIALQDSVGHAIPRLVCI
ncbi:PREDICTED: uncharacterized protein LOC104719481 [Camelina sativa]|uniref:Uncharacterized protein LOC104719481 n=1 Tax=Camelina sativa TaxID=90675 RepID=A0ABM0U4K4_CAMSA|nr:PREDICTED: uncharacterized protein LOC104719481 [Camelina sativa]